jgi:hypothetical protein
MEGSELMVKTPYVTPQVIYLRDPPSSEPSFGKIAANGLAVGGRIYTGFGAVIGVIIMVVMIIIGSTKLYDKHTASATMIITSVVDCAKQEVSTSQGQIAVTYSCSIQVSFTADGKAYSSLAPINVMAPYPLSAGMTIVLRYDPNAPTDIVQESSPRAVGWMLIGGGAAIGVVSVGMAVLAFKSKGAAEFMGATSLIGAFRR